MCKRLLIGVLAVGLSWPLVTLAQSNPDDVRFEIPLNLTQLHPAITQVEVDCKLTSDAIPGSKLAKAARKGTNNWRGVQLPVTDGKVVTTAVIVFSFPPGSLNNPAGKTANYECTLTAYSKGAPAAKASTSRGPTYKAGWDSFAEKHADPAFVLTPTPQKLTGTFTWGPNTKP
jgi:hypothetical protein